MASTATAVAADWIEVQHRGFTVARGFLSADECEAMRRDYESAEVDGNRNYQLRPVGLKAFALVRRKLDAVAAALRATTDVTVNSFQGATYFANEINSLAWHQEFEPYYLCEDLYNYVNFYIPFVKPDPTRSNLTVVPFDTLRARDRAAYDLLYREGARRFELVGGRTIVYDSTHGTRVELALDLEAIAETPPLHAGDLLVVRGDVVHRTQDSSTRRIAASFRLARAESVVHLARLAECGPQKLQVMLRNRRTFECAFQHFAETGRDETTVELLSKHLRARLPTYVPSSRALLRMLATIAPRFHYRALWRGRLGAGLSSNASRPNAGSR
jgi:hypothetical protein